MRRVNYNVAAMRVLRTTKVFLPQKTIEDMSSLIFEPAARHKWEAIYR